MTAFHRFTPRIAAARSRPRLLSTRRRRLAALTGLAAMCLVGPVMLASFLLLNLLGAI
jgi:hypothetical protein